MYEENERQAREKYEYVFKQWEYLQKLGSFKEWKYISRLKGVTVTHE